MYEDGSRWVPQRKDGLLTKITTPLTPKKFYAPSKVKTDVWSRHILYSCWEEEIHFWVRHDSLFLHNPAIILYKIWPNSPAEIPRTRFRKRLDCVCASSCGEVGNHGSDAILAEPVSSKIPLQAVGTVDWKISQTCQLQSSRGVKILDKVEDRILSITCTFRAAQLTGD